jgi:hypothetical protein
MRKKLVHGVGINDADYTVKPTVNGRRVFCPFYVTWCNMLQRCYSKKYQLTRPRYAGCSVSSELHIFSSFKRWMEQQNWQGKELDKDLIIPGNRIYSPERCVFVDLITNSFANDCEANRGEWPLGVCFHAGLGKFQSNCRNPFTKKLEHLGYFDCPNEAHEAWKNRKRQLSLSLADLQPSKAVADTLRLMYL